MGLGIDTSAHRHAMAKSNKYRKWERNYRQRIKSLEHRILMRMLTDHPTEALQEQLEAQRRILTKRKERAARLREWEKEIKQAKLEERKAKYEEGKDSTNGGLLG